MEGVNVRLEILDPLSKKMYLGNWVFTEQALEAVGVRERRDKITHLCVEMLKSDSIYDTTAINVN